MKIPTIILSVFLTFCCLVLRAQNPLIIANVSQGCDSLTVNFSFSTTLPSVTSILWRFGDGIIDNTNNSTPVKKYSRPGSYNVFLKLNGTDSTTSANLISVGRTPDIDSLNLVITSRDTSGAGKLNKVIEVNYNNNHPFPYTYQWSVEGVFASTNKRFVQQFDTAGIYHLSLKMTDQIGCTSNFNGTFNVLADLIIPDVFTPNGDNVYDDFVIKSNGQDNILLSIYTRAGLLIYKAEAKTIIWDGRLPSGDKVLPGIYYYIVESISGTAGKKKSGFVYIFY